MTPPLSGDLIAIDDGTPVFRYDPVAPLLSSAHEPIRYWARRDLLRARVGPVDGLWDDPALGKLLRAQRADGSWRYRGGSEHLRARSGYDQLETYRWLGELVEKYGMTHRHGSLARAAEFLLGFQTDEGDIRGIYGTQYSPNYSAAIVELLVKAGFGDDRRVRRVFDWLAATRQDDGGWAIPLRTRGRTFSCLGDTTITADRTKPSSHLVTGVVLRAFAVHPRRRRGAVARHGASLLAASLFNRDRYPDRAAPDFWTRCGFPFWHTDVIAALDTLGRIGHPASDPQVRRALAWLAGRQRPDGSFELTLLRTRDKALPQWLGLAICRAVMRFGLIPHGHGGRADAPTEGRVPGEGRHRGEAHRT